MGLIVLFDIDGTLITTGGAGRRAIQRAVAGLSKAGEDETELGFSFAGMTDRAIMRRALDETGQPVDEARIDAALDAYLKLLPAEVQTAVDYRVFEGIRPLLEELSAQREVAMGLGTGNARRGARIKLGRGRLEQYFSFGGFGCECESRPELIGRGIERGAAMLERPPAHCRVVVVGDTPADIEAARENGADVVAVCTGSWSKSRLAEHNPDWLVDSLADEVVRQLLALD